MRNLINTSRYIDLTNDPLFPFGFGLSYTRFEYSALELNNRTITDGDELELKAAIRNTGDRFGEEVVQLYIQDVSATVSRPVRELKRFQKIGLAPGETKEVKFTLGIEDLLYFGANHQWGIEPGTIRVWVGPNAMEGLESSFEIQ